jgi:sugar-specific transcriptional regulator TrmB
VEDTLTIDDYAYSDYTLTDYQVGDTIDLVDMEELNRRVQEELDDLTDDYKAKLEACQEDSEKEEVENWYSQQKVQSIRKCTADLVEEGKVETYTIEGIVSQDVNLYRGGVETQALRIIMPTDRTE